MAGNYGEYRRIRYDRTYRTLGKMSWWRIVLGLVLLFSVFFISGFVSQSLAIRGHFRMAERMMLSPSWMERHKPELKDWIEAGALAETGEIDTFLKDLAALDTASLPDDLQEAWRALCRDVLETDDLSESQRESLSSFLNKTAPSEEGAGMEAEPESVQA